MKDTRFRTRGRVTSAYLHRSHQSSLLEAILPTSTHHLRDAITGVPGGPASSTFTSWWLGSWGHESPDAAECGLPASLTHLQAKASSSPLDRLVNFCFVRALRVARTFMLRATDGIAQSLVQPCFDCVASRLYYLFASANSTFSAWSALRSGLLHHTAEGPCAYAHRQRSVTAQFIALIAWTSSQRSMEAHGTEAEQPATGTLVSMDPILRWRRRGIAKSSPSRPNGGGGGGRDGQAPRSRRVWVLGENAPYVLTQNMLGFGRDEVDGKYVARDPKLVTCTTPKDRSGFSPRPKNRRWTVYSMTEVARSTPQVSGVVTRAQGGLAGTVVSPDSGMRESTPQARDELHHARPTPCLDAEMPAMGLFVARQDNRHRGWEARDGRMGKLERYPKALKRWRPARLPLSLMPPEMK
ncbi:hypothetical protein Purlil1_11643 [Purpureocillium lilacinum]|uniref:Uncharacterized protein n=1 Tax=Purpureocillium lilacinum TaxID=33203 RepID=A0ABR0BJ45_PURLI|nr:hypothetical protein Purlil1_11643 [Purpureocillium lilacinum]